MRGLKEFIKAKTPDRPPGSIERRTDFMYMDGHGTFYRFEEGYIPYDLPDKERWSRVTLVMYNINTDRLDEVSFELLSSWMIGERYMYIRGHVEADEGHFEIQMYYDLQKPLDSDILVLQTAPY